MPQRHKRRLWIALITTLGAIALLAAVWFIPTRIPPTWVKATPFSAAFATESYLAQGSKNPSYLQFNLQYEAIGADFESSTRITARLTDRVYLHDNTDDSIQGDREDALRRIRNRYPELCDSAGYPGLTVRFQDLVAAGNAGVTVDYPERRITAILMASRRYLGYAAVTALTISAPLTFYFLYAFIKARRNARANCCSRCGYNLTGLTLCPECGLDITAALSRTRRRGTKRLIAGATLLILGLGLGVAWIATARAFLLTLGLRARKRSSPVQVSPVSSNAQGTI